MLGVHFGVYLQELGTELEGLDLILPRIDIVAFYDDLDHLGPGGEGFGVLEHLLDELLRQGLVLVD